MSTHPFAYLLVLVGFASFVLGAKCEGSEAADQQAVQDQQLHYQKVQPLPRFEYSLERDVMIQLYRARNERVATWTVWRSNSGIIEGDCPSIGYPLPNDVGLTNPLQRITDANGAVAIEQAEPNGLFSSKNTVATWVRCIVEVDEVRVEAPVYVESKVTAYPFPVKVDYEANHVTPVAGSKPSITIEKKAPVAASDGSGSP